MSTSLELLLATLFVGNLIIGPISLAIMSVWPNKPEVVL